MTSLIVPHLGYNRHASDRMQVGQALVTPQTYCDGNLASVDHTTQHPVQQTVQEPTSEADEADNSNDGSFGQYSAYLHDDASVSNFQAYQSTHQAARPSQMPVSSG